jgi:hypothetical protein
MSTSKSISEPLFPTNYPDYVYNFAYGSNMYPNVLTGRRKIHPIESIPGVFEGWQLTFDLRGIPAVEPCFGNIKENVESEIHGVLHKMTNTQFKHLMATEGGGGVDANGYIPTKVNVHAYDGRIIEAYALVVHQTSSALVIWVFYAMVQNIIIFIHCILNIYSRFLRLNVTNLSRH